MFQPIYQSYQQQQQFTANAAHELRSPLASLLATVEAILRIPQSNQQDMQIMLHTVERQGRRLSHCRKPGLEPLTTSKSVWKNE